MSYDVKILASTAVGDGPESPVFRATTKRRMWCSALCILAIIGCNSRARNGINRAVLRIFFTHH